MPVSATHRSAKSTKAAMLILSQNLRRRRRALKLRQSDLAERLGYTGRNTGSSIARYESGRQMPNLATLHRLAEALRTTVSGLTRKQKENR
jgi:transcriptional regulator with XRE-family HTH domain